MNKLTLEKIVTPLLKACKDEGVMYKEAAKIFNTEPAYFKMLEREDKREAIPEKVMDRFHSWVYSGKKLKEYKMPGSFEEAQREADAGMGNRINEEMAEILNNSGATIIEPKEWTIIGPYDSIPKLTKAVAEHEKKAKRKKELAEKRLNKALEKSHEKAMVKVGKKPKRKYTRKPKESPPEFTSPDFSDIQIIPVAKVAPDVRPDVYLDVPDIQMVESDIQMVESDIQMVESETDLLKSEIKTLAALLKRECEAAEVLRAQNGYLNFMVSYKERMIEVLKENYEKMSDWKNQIGGYNYKLHHRGFWARVFNRPVK